MKLLGKINYINFDYQIFLDMQKHKIDNETMKNVKNDKNKQ